MKNKIRLNFEKMIVEISVSENFNDQITLENNAEQIVIAFVKYEFVFMISINEDDSFIDVNVFDVVAFSRLIKKKNHNLKIFNLKNIEKRLSIKFKSNFVTFI